MAAQLSHAIAAYQPRPRTTTMPAAAWTTATTADSPFTTAASISPPPIIRTRPATIPTGHCTNSIFTWRRRVPADGEKLKRFTTENRFSLCNDCNRLKFSLRRSRGGRRDSNPQQPEPQSGALPLSYDHHRGTGNKSLKVECFFANKGLDFSTSLH